MDVATTKNRALDVLEGFLTSLDVDVELGLLPDIESQVTSRRHSAFCNKTNTILLTPDAAIRSHTIPEEVTHQLRFMFRKKPARKTESLQKKSAEEFFGRLGESYFYEVIDQQPERQDALRNCSDSTTFRHNATKVYELFKRSTENKQALKQGVKEITDAISFVNKTLKTAKQILSDHETEPNEKKQKAAELHDEYMDTVMHKYDLTGALKLMLETYYNPLSFLATDPDSEVSKERITWMEQDILGLKQRATQALQRNARVSKAQYVSSVSHLLGYCAAELYMEDNPEWKDEFSELISLPADQIYNTHINSQKARRLLHTKGLTKIMQEIVESS